MRTEHHKGVIASVKRNGFGLTRKLKGETSFSLFELRLQVFRFPVLFGTSSMNCPDTSVLARMFLGIVPSDGRFFDMVLDAFRETTLAEGAGPAASSKRDVGRSIDMVSDNSTDGKDLRSVNTRVTGAKVTCPNTGQDTTRRGSEDHGTMRTSPLTLIFNTGSAALLLAPDTDQLLSTGRSSIVNLSGSTSPNMG